MKVTIDEKTVEIIKNMLKEQNKTAVRIAKTGVACGGIQKEIVMDEEKENDDVVMDQGIKIVADKSISFYFTSAVITHKEGIYGIRFKVV
ncbi:adhesin [Clostridium sp. P21]|uniref:Adhesin n=1 Tax=Clostridium muellerianum TaxID=2716538 RepID=A0A7Y0EHN8_9CLOT|nr:iron-sulfur cluster biosynthesis family protein [Clostridium muellerianum]NMM63653.1 adhesin [Clostridium muellerianum]